MFVGGGAHLPHLKGRMLEALRSFGDARRARKLKSYQLANVIQFIQIGFPGTLPTGYFRAPGPCHPVEGG